MSEMDEIDKGQQRQIDELYGLVKNILWAGVLMSILMFSSLILALWEAHQR